MNSAVNSNLVHEAEAQRQHARIMIPAELVLTLKNDKLLKLSVQDLSAGGFSVTSKKQPLKVGSQYTGSLVFQVDSLEFSLQVSFSAKKVDEVSGRVGCEFQNMGAQEISTLRHLITSHLSGEIVTMGGLMNTLSRQNFTKARNGKADNAGMNLLKRFKAVTFSSIIFLVGIVAFASVMNTVYKNYVLTRATSAKVVVESIDITMPKDGIVKSLLEEQQTSVTAGRQILQYEAPYTELLKSTFENSNPKEALAVANALQKSFTGTLISPCDCVIVNNKALNGSFMAKGSTLLTLVDKKNTPEISAYFNYRDLNDLNPGTKVKVYVPGQKGMMTGEVTEVSMSNLFSGESQITGGAMVNVRIQLEKALPLEWVGMPVEVTVNPNFSII